MSALSQPTINSFICLFNSRKKMERAVKSRLFLFPLEFFKAIILKLSVWFHSLTLKLESDK